MSAFVSAVIVAAGGSVRMGIADSKQFIPLLSRPAIEYTLRAFQKCHLIKEIVIVCREQDNDRINKIIELNGFSKVSKLVKGGESRADSVRNGIGACSENAKYYAIHDGARPLITVEEIERDLYRFALENAGDNIINFTDDCSLIENMGGEVLVVKGNEENIKLTTPIDIVIAESILKSRQQG